MIAGSPTSAINIERIEDGRHRILNGVEAILKNLAQLDRIAEEGMPLAVGGGAATGASDAEGEKKPKRVLLIRIRPSRRALRRARRVPGRPPGHDDPIDPATGKPIVH